MVVGGAMLAARESLLLGGLAVLGGLALLVFGAWVLSRERGHRHGAEESEHATR
jgi:hypothetical protein